MTLLISLASLSEQYKQELIRLLEPKIFDDGTYIIRQGSTDGGFYIIEQGSVMLTARKQTDDIMQLEEEVKTKERQIEEQRESS